MSEESANQSEGSSDGTESTHPDATERKPNKLRGLTVSVVRTLILIYVIVLVGLVALEPRLLFPGAYMSPDWNDTHPSVQSFPYDAVDGRTITGRLAERAGAQRTVLFFHGNGIQAKELDLWTLRLSRDLNANVLTAEYRGYQFDEITPSEKNIVEDALSAHDALCEHYNIRSQDLVIYGRSLGGGCAAAVAEKRKTKILILDRTFDSIVNVAASKLPIFPIRLLMRNRFDSVSRLKEFDGHVYQFHGTADSLIPIRIGKKLFDELSTEHKTFAKVKDLDHNDLVPKKTMGVINHFIALAEADQE